jgi:hypothetical protein
VHAAGRDATVESSLAYCSAARVHAECGVIHGERRVAE